jgi:hypothetical protein
MAEKLSEEDAAHQEATEEDAVIQRMLENKGIEIDQYYDTLH